MTPRIDLEVIGSRGSVPVMAILDTGFDDQLCLPIRLAVTMGVVDYRPREWTDGCSACSVTLGKWSTLKE